MLSYQHAYHAGNAADVHKHAALAGLLAHLTEKPRGISYAETHAGRGLYRLDSPEAARTGEAAEGVARIALDPATPYGRAVAEVRARHGAEAYPGSPLVARALLRPQDRITLMELHPAEHPALRRAVADAGAGAGAAVHRRDGFEGVMALAPLQPRRGLVLVDPSYEVKDEYAAAAAFARRLAVKWPEAAILIWYPLLPARRHGELLLGLAPLSPLIDEVSFRRPPARGMTGSGLALVNPPHDAPAILAGARAAGREIFA